MQIEHPTITQMERTGYANLVDQEEHFGIDYFGDEILSGDEYVEDENGELVLKDNLEKYLSKFYGFTFSEA
ncbi:hypothetical protein LC087_19305 (plasmid) [Bacillus carboniphilus]|uniref:YqaI-like protein n=1 Tax=Bacillus carboniphilus TaxID=86663 RepID=A0ABY9JYP4_9BACI|nr:hypothetical protein [Bacillus carboniphilus]WLR44516.1 hypothetical protein LC087_19305 [Bacillus carboniphilus]